MPSYKNEQRNSWYVSFYYTDWTGKRRKKKKEGFISKKDALAFERDFLEKASGQCTIRFNILINTYLDDCKKRIKHSTFVTKNTIIQKHIAPFFVDMPVNEINSATIRKWQEWILENHENKTAQYLHYINTQLSCIFNFAKKYYNLNSNPVKQCRCMGDTKTRKKSFWTLEEFDMFIEKIDKTNVYYTIFNVLFWTGIRRGELLALRPMDFDFKNKQLSIRRNLVFVKNKPQMNTPKTETSWRLISVPDFLLNIVKEYIKREKIKDDQLLFGFKPRQIMQKIREYSRLAGVKPIRIHDFRRSHTSLLIEQGYSPMLIAERLGHKDVSVTLKIYAYLYPNKHKQLAGYLDSLYEKIKK